MLPGPMHASLAYGLTALLAGACGIALWQEPAIANGALDAVAGQFLASLSPALRQQAQTGLDDATRTQWNFVPQEYPGVAFGALDQGQLQQAHALLDMLPDEKLNAVRTLLEVMVEPLLRATSHRNLPDDE